MSEETVLVFEYTPKIEACPECGKDVFIVVAHDARGIGYRYWACRNCEWHEDLGSWILLDHADYWDWLCFPALSDDSQWELKTRRVVKE